MIPVSSPLIAKNASKYLQECLRTGWVSSAGSFVERFEDAFAQFVGTKYAVAVSSGTAAIHLSLAALNIGKGDEVIIPSYTMIATLLPVLYQGATPILVDVDAQTGNINPSLLEQKITKHTKAIIPVHMFGHPVDMKPILQIAQTHKVAIVEDAAEAHGAEYLLNKKWKRVGSLGNTGCFSFYGNKIITTGEGGMVTTDNKHLAQRLRSLRNLARTPGKHSLHQELAFAYRMSNLQAAVGLAEVEEIDSYIKRKLEIAQLYTQQLGDIKQIILPQKKSYAKSVFWQYGILLKEKKHFEKLARYLDKKGIETRGFFVPMHRQPACQKLGLFAHQTYPMSEYLADHGICLPAGVAIPNRDIIYIAEAIKTFFQKI